MIGGAFMGTMLAQQHTLPYDYEVAYLQSSGTQYIDLGFRANINTKAEVRMQYHVLSSASGSATVFGARVTYNDRAFSFSTDTGYTSTNTEYGGQFDSAGISYAVHYRVDTHEHTLTLDRTGGYVDEVKTTIFSNVRDYESGSIYLFGRNSNPLALAVCRVMRAQFWDGTTLIRDLIPVIKDAEPCMYDMVHDVFYHNVGTGSFVAGPRV